MKSGKVVPSDTSAALRYLTASGDIVEFTAETLQTLAKYRQRRFWQSEAGGQLFADVLGKLVRVVHASKPKKADLRARFGFAPHRPTEQSEINELHAHGLHYVGDWHSHAQDRPAPSTTDAKSINECFRKSKHDLSGFVLAIVGKQAFPGGLYVGLADGVQVVELISQTEQRTGELTDR